MDQACRGEGGRKTTSAAPSQGPEVWGLPRVTPVAPGRPQPWACGPTCRLARVGGPCSGGGGLVAAGVQGGGRAGACGWHSPCLGVAEWRGPGQQRASLLTVMVTAWVLLSPGPGRLALWTVWMPPWTSVWRALRGLQPRHLFQLFAGPHQHSLAQRRPCSFQGSLCAPGACLACIGSLTWPRLSFLVAAGMGFPGGRGEGAVQCTAGRREALEATGLAVRPSPALGAPRTRVGCTVPDPLARGGGAAESRALGEDGMCIPEIRGSGGPAIPDPITGSEAGVLGSPPPRS